MNARDAVLVLAVLAVALAVRLLHQAVAAEAGLLDDLFLDSRWYAEEAARIASGAADVRRPYLLSPLYPYVLAPFTSAGGGLDVGAVRGLQACAGSAAAALAALLALRLAGRAAGWTAGLAAALFGPLVHADALILVASLQGALLTLAVVLFSAPRPGAPPRTRAVAWAASGLALGLAAALHPTSLAVAAALLALAAARPAPGRWGAAGLLALGVALPLAPVAAHNLRQSGELVLLSANGGMNFWIGNHAGASGLFQPPPGYDAVRDPVAKSLAEREVGAPLTWSEASAWWRGRALADVAEAPAAWIGLLARKALLFGHPREIPQLGESFGWFRERSWTLSFPLDARLVLLLAIAAPIAAALRSGRAAIAPLLPPLAAFAAYAAGVVLFFVTGRYRVPILPVAIALAAVGLVETLALLRARRWEHPGAVLALCAGLVGLLAASRFVYETEGAPLALPAATGVEERHAGMSLYRQGRYAQAVAAYERSLAIRDDAATRINLGNALKPLGRVDEALVEYRLAIDLDPRNALAWYNLGNLLRREKGDFRAAADAYARAVELAPDFAEAHFNYGAVLLDLGQPVDAAAEIEAALAAAAPDAPWRAQAEAALVAARMAAAGTER